MPTRKRKSPVTAKTGKASPRRKRKPAKRNEQIDPEYSLDVLHGELRNVFQSRMIKRLKR